MLPNHPHTAGAALVETTGSVRPVNRKRHARIRACRNERLLPRAKFPASSRCPETNPSRIATPCWLD